LISGEGLKPESINTTATVSLGGDDTGPKVEHILLSTKVKCEGLAEDKFNELAQAAKEKCPISRLYAGGTATVELEAELL
jgi:osmotically inducible protein OsmC